MLKRSSGLFLIVILSLLMAGLWLALSPEPALAANYTVTNTNDSGAGSLRQAIIDANTNPGADTIDFNIGVGPNTISPTSPLPDITGQVTIDGYTEPGASPANGGAATIMIRIDGNSAGAGANGLRFAAGSANSRVRGLTISRFSSSGIEIDAATGVTVDGNYIGTDETGLIDRGNTNGINMMNGADNAVIGGTTASALNLISGNVTSGMYIDNCSGCLVQGNLFGTDITGGTELHNSFSGVVLRNGSSGNTVGGSVAGARNVISGNLGSGVTIMTNATGNYVQGNYIGTNAGATAALANGDYGVYLLSNAGGNTIGGTGADEGNLISGNTADGIRIAASTGNAILGNRIGTNAAGTASLPNDGAGVALVADADINTVGGSAAGAGNLISGNGADGIAINAADSNTVEGNFIGTNAAGTAALANGDDGITIIATSTGNAIGGTTTEQRNVISGNTRHGIQIDDSSNNTVSGNYIGVNVNGNAAMMNHDTGVRIENGATFNIIGGNTSGHRNVISGNGLYEIYMTGSTSNTFQGNYIGTDATGTFSLATFYASSGIFMQSNSNNNTIGESGAGEGNLISGNNAEGIRIDGSSGNDILGNRIGTNAAGTAALENQNGVVLINNANNNNVGGSSPGEGNLLSGNQNIGVVISNSDGNVVAGNQIGTDLSGTAALANGIYGMYLGDANDNTVGGATTAHGNVISGNPTAGIYISGSSGTTIAANYIGTNAAGTSAIPNAIGVFCDSGTTNSNIGMGMAAERNIISGNNTSGIQLVGATDNTVWGNYIGTDASGTAALPNGTYGLAITSGSNNTAVGVYAAANNVIANNGSDGVSITGSTDCEISHNQITDNTGIGVVVWDAASIRNKISENSTYGNGGLGIDLLGDGVTPNDGNNNNPAKPNRGYNFPVFSSDPVLLIGSDTYISGTAPPNSLVEFYYTGAAPDPSGHGEGQTYLGHITVDGTGYFYGALSGLSDGDKLSAIAISPAGDPSGEGNTSEFSENVTVAQTYVVNAVVSGTGGTVDPASQLVIKGDNASIDITAAAGYRIESITDNGAPVPVADPYVINNIQEGHDVVVTFTADVQPTVFYFAEGYTGGGFQEFLCLANPGDTGTFATITYMFPDGTTQEQEVELGANSRLTVNVNDEVGADKEVSAVVGCDQPIVAERPMYFSYQGKWTGGHDVVGATRTSGTWYFAEGYTGAGFDEWICVLNPGDSVADLTFRFQTQEEGEKVVTGFGVPAHSRRSFKVNDLLGGAYQTSLALESTQPVVAERPMYFSYSGTGGWGWTGGHCVMGAPCLAKQYYFAEGTTRPGFEEWLTIQNPGTDPIDVEATYMLETGQTVDKTYQVPAGERSTVFVPNEVGADQDVSAYLFCTSPFLAERPMYFSYGGMMDWGWTGGHCVIGANKTSTWWYFAEGYTGAGFEEWLCIQNPGTEKAAVTINYYPEGGAAPITRVHEVAADSRFTIPVNVDAGTGLTISTEVTSTQPVSCERPMYFDYGPGWTGGHDVVGFTP